jgi:hypothetical protein
MHRTVAFSFVILLASAALAAQSAPQSKEGLQSTKTVIVNPGEAAPSCPIAMSARHAGGGEMVKVSPGEPAQQIPVQRLTLTLTRPNSPGIAAATVTVHGFTGKTRYVPLGASEAARDGKTVDDGKTIDVAFAAGSTATLLRAPGFTAVTRIDLESVTYADGATWKSDGRVCSVTPDGLMLVNAR